MHNQRIEFYDRVNSKTTMANSKSPQNKTSCTHKICTGEILPHQVRLAAGLPVWQVLSQFHNLGAQTLTTLNPRTAYTVPHASDAWQQVLASLTLSPDTQQPAAKTHNVYLALEEVRVTGCFRHTGVQVWEWVLMSGVIRA